MNMKNIHIIITAALISFSGIAYGIDGCFDLERSTSTCKTTTLRTKHNDLLKITLIGEKGDQTFSEIYYQDKAIYVSNNDYSVLANHYYTNDLLVVEIEVSTGNAYTATVLLVFKNKAFIRLIDPSEIGDKAIKLGYDDRFSQIVFNDSLKFKGNILSYNNFSNKFDLRVNLITGKVIPVGKKKKKNQVSDGSGDIYNVINNNNGVKVIGKRIVIYLGKKCDALVIYNKKGKKIKAKGKWVENVSRASHGTEVTFKVNGKIKSLFFPDQFFFPDCGDDS